MNRLLGEGGSRGTDAYDSAYVVNDNVQQAANKQPEMLPLNNNSIPSISALKAMFGPITGSGMPDIISDKIYDSKLLTASSVNNLTFFNTVSTNLALSNVQNANQLPSQEAFYMTGIRFEFFSEDTTAGTTGYDFLQLFTALRTGYYQFNIANKPYVGPHYLQWYINCQAPLAFNTRAYSINPYKTWLLPWKIAIPPLTTFSLTATLTPPAEINTSDMYLRAVLEGFRYRAIQ